MSNARTALSLDSAAQQARTVALQAIDQLNGTFVQRAQAIETIWLALLTGQNFLLVGDPGTAKTALVHACYAHIESARTFGTLCGSFATEDKMFGPVDIQAFKTGEWRRVTKNRLADCELAFLDEMFKSNDGTLNGMLTALNERKYEGEAIPLWTCGAATNWPEVRNRSENVAALWDRMLLRCHVREVAGDQARMELLSAVDKVRLYQPKAKITLEQLKAAREEIARVEVSDAVRASLLDVEKRLEKQNIKNSSRRIGAMQIVLRAKAWLRGDAVPGCPGGDDAEPILPRAGLDDFAALELGLWNNDADIEPLCEILKTVDAAVVSKAVQQLVEATRQCSQQVPVGQIPRLIQMAANAAGEAKKLIDEQGVRAEGRKQITEQIRKLKGTYEALKQQVGPHLKDGSVKALPAGGAR